MKKFIILFLIFFLIAFYFLFAREEIQPVCDLNCSIVTVTCPDGFVASCNSTCDPLTKTCVNCIPDCRNHETPVEKPEANLSKIVLCPQVLLSPDFCKDGEIQPIYNEIGCIVAYSCI